MSIEKKKGMRMEPRDLPTLRSERNKWGEGKGLRGGSNREEESTSRRCMVISGIRSMEILMRRVSVVQNESKWI
jgi:hypothetical protein